MTVLGNGKDGIHRKESTAAGEPVVCTQLLEETSSDVIPLLSQLAALDGCICLSVLPDSYKERKILVPNGTVTVFSEYIVPKAITNSINCGIGLLKFDLPPAEVEAARDSLNQTMHLLLQERSIALSARQFVEICQEGASALAACLDIGSDCLHRFQDHGSSNIDVLQKESIPVQAAVPPWALKNRDLRTVPGNVFSGTHFIEWLKLGKTLGRAAADLSVDSSYCAYHLDEPMGKMISWTYSIRKWEKRQPLRLMRSLVRNACFHARVQGLTSLGSISKHFLSLGGFHAIPLDTVEGQRYLAAIRYATNFSNAARLALIDLIVAAVQRTFSRSVEWELLFDSGHGGFRVEQSDGAPVLVSRKGCVSATPHALGMISGRYDIPSILVEAGSESSLSLPWLRSFDHGIGGHIWRDVFRDSDAADQNEGIGRVACYRPRSTVRPINMKTDVWHREVYVGPALRHALRTYEAGDPPVKPIGLLYPMTNYKLHTRQSRLNQARYRMLRTGYDALHRLSPSTAKWLLNKIWGK